MPLCWVAGLALLALPGQPRAAEEFLSKGAGTPQQPWTEVARLFGSDQAEFWSFGSGVALSGEIAVIGANGATVTEPFQGAAYVFVPSGGSWIEEAQLVASDPGADDWFGASVAIDGDMAVVGARDADVGGTSHQGAAYVFRRNEGVWTQQQKLTASDGDAQDRFGISVDIRDDTLLVGARGADILGNNVQGAAYVFVEEAGFWTEKAKLFDPGGQAADAFGNAVALDGDVAFIGASSANVNGGANQGAAYVFRGSGASWTLEQRLVATDGGSIDQFGVAIAIEGDTALIGAKFKPVGGSIRQGGAYIFQHSNGVWKETQQLTASNGHADSRYGEGVALKGSTALVGGELTFGGSTMRGVVYEYRLNEDWQEVAWFPAPVGHGFDNFGKKIALEGGLAVVSNTGNLVTQPPGGTAWIFQQPSLFEDGFESGDTSAWSTTVP